MNTSNGAKKLAAASAGTDTPESWNEEKGPIERFKIVDQLILWSSETSIDFFLS